ncbi:hypothetical protein ACVPPR_01540 [Dellaglioa sp. L3N]
MTGVKPDNGIEKALIGVEKNNFEAIVVDDATINNSSMIQKRILHTFAHIAFTDDLFNSCVVWC